MKVMMKNKRNIAVFDDDYDDEKSTAKSTVKSEACST